MQREEDEWICPSFNSYSLTKSAETAARVAGEAAQDGQHSHENLPRISENDEDDFEFSLVIDDELEVSGDNAMKVSGKSFFPIFNRDIVDDFDSVNQEGKINPINVPLSRLFIEDDEASSSTCSSEADEMDSIPPGTYCVWKPKAVEASPSGCKKSKSTGFGSRRWKLRDLLLRRSNSEGKRDSFVFLTPKTKEDNIIQMHSTKSRESPVTKVVISKKSTATGATSSPRMVYSPANRSLLRGDETPKRAVKGKGEMVKRKSYLPYRQDLVGFFTTVNTLGRNFSPR